MARPKATGEVSDIVPPHLRWGCCSHPHHRDDEAGGNKRGVTAAPGLILPFWATLVTQDKHGPLGTAKPALPSDTAS